MVIVTGLYLREGSAGKNSYAAGDMSAGGRGLDNPNTCFGLNQLCQMIEFSNSLSPNVQLDFSWTLEVSDRQNKSVRKAI